MTTSEIRDKFEGEAVRLRPTVLRIAMSIVRNEHDADDIAQETLLKLWFLRDRLDRYASIDALAKVIARNLSLNRIRDRRTTVSVEDPIVRNMAVDDCAETVIPDELLRVIDRLPDKENAVLRMKHIDGLETDEIARLIHSSPGAVRTALSRARERIRKLYMQNSR